MDDRGGGIAEIGGNDALHGVQPVHAIGVVRDRPGELQGRIVVAGPLAGAGPQGAAVLGPVEGAAVGLPGLVNERLQLGAGGVGGVHLTGQRRGVGDAHEQIGRGAAERAGPQERLQPLDESGAAAQVPPQLGIGG